MKKLILPALLALTLALPGSEKAGRQGPETLIPNKE